MQEYYKLQQTVYGGNMNKVLKISLAEADLTVKELAKKVDRSPTYVSQILCGLYIQRDMREKIAKIIGKPTSVLWPQENRKTST